MLFRSEAARGEGGRLFAMKDGKQWYFMEEKYPELGNLMPRDIAAREIWKVSHESEVFLDMTEISDEIISNKLSGLADDCMTYLHKDIRKDVYKRQGISECGVFIFCPLYNSSIVLYNEKIMQDLSKIRSYNSLSLIHILEQFPSSR